MTHMTHTISKPARASVADDSQRASVAAIASGRVHSA